MSQHFPSVYGSEFTVEIKKVEVREHYTLRLESIVRGTDPATELVVAYTNCENRFYLGDSSAANYYVDDLGVTQHLQPQPGGKTVCMGFNPETQQWFAWSHRACASFGIGTQVTKASCGFEPSNREEMEESLLRWWDNGLTQSFETAEGQTVTYVTSCVAEQDFLGPIAEGGTMPQKGIRVVKTCTYSDGRAPLVSDFFNAYPEVWGRGEWIAATLDEAKEMALAFARSVS